MLFQSLKLLEMIALQINQRLAQKNSIQREHVEIGLESQNATVNQWQGMEISHPRVASAFPKVRTLAFAVAMLCVPKSPMLCVPKSPTLPLHLILLTFRLLLVIQVSFK